MRLLLVEDEENVTAFIRKGLEEESYDVDVAEDGSEGLIVATSNEYDLIVMDIMLPGIDGIELCRRLREKRDKDSHFVAYCHRFREQQDARA